MLKNVLLLCLFVVLLASCQTMKFTQIEVLVPAKVIYPPQAQKVLLVNNAPKQPAEIGHNSYLQKFRRGKPTMNLVDKDTVKLDSLGFSCLYNASNHLNATGFFESVDVYPDKMYTSDYYASESRLTRLQLEKLFTETGSDVILSLDRLSFESKLIVREYLTGFYEDPTMDINFEAVWRVYLPNQYQSIDRVILRDTIYWDAELEGDTYKVVPRNDAISDAIWVAGEKSAKELAPYWTSVSRFYYQKGNPQLKLAGQYFEQGDWDKAKDLWEVVYYTYKKRQKAMAAVNLAYHSELTGDLDEALSWINKSLQVFQGMNDFDYNYEYEMAKSYKKILLRRASDDKRLKKQYSVEGKDQ